MGFLSKKLHNIASKTQDIGESAIKGIQDEHQAYKAATEFEEQQKANGYLKEIMKARGMDEATAARYVELSNKYQDASKNGRKEEEKQLTEEMARLNSQAMTNLAPKAAEPQSSLVDEVTKLAKLKEQGAITESEFVLMKQELIRKSSSQPASPVQQHYPYGTGTPWDYMRTIYGASYLPASSPTISNRPLPSDMNKVQHMILVQLRAGVKNPKHIEQMLSMDRKEIEKEIERLIANGYVTSDKKLTSKGLEVL